MYRNEPYSSDEKKMTLLICAIAVVVSLVISFVVVGSTSKKINNYESAVKISSNEQFKYAVETQYSGGLFGNGIVEMNPVTNSKLSVPFGKIIDITERYTMHTRQVCNGYDKDGHCTGYRTEIYYEWDRESTNVTISDTLTFMGKEFPTNQIGVKEKERLNLDSSNVSSEWIEKTKWNYIYEENPFWESVGDLRHYYEVVPVVFMGTLYVRSNSNGYINELGKPCGCEITAKTPEEIIKSAKSGRFFIQFVFPFLLPLLVGVGLVLYFYNN